LLKRNEKNIVLYSNVFYIISKIIEPGLTRTLKLRLRKGDTFVDIGANIGYYSILASKICGPSGMVLSFEPDPNHFNSLVRNCRYNNCQNIVFEQKGLGRETKSGRLYLNPVNTSDHSTYPIDDRKSIDIKITSVDEYLESKMITKVDFIKLDVQGSEPSVFQGMLKTIDSNPDVTIITEFSPKWLKRSKNCPNDYLKILEELGFEPYLVKERSNLVKISYNSIYSHLKDRIEIDIMLKKPTL